jgi:hypothetical protein
MSTKDPVQFGRAVLARREELGLSQLDVWHKRGPSNTTLTAIENGRMSDLTPATAKKLDNGLDWEPGGALRLWRDGVTPSPVARDTREGTLDGIAGGVRSRPRRPRGVLGDAAFAAGLADRVEELEERLSAIEKLIYDDDQQGEEVMGNAQHPAPIDPTLSEVPPSLAPAADESPLEGSGENSI